MKRFKYLITLLMLVMTAAHGAGGMSLKEGLGKILVKGDTLLKNTFKLSDEQAVSLNKDFDTSYKKDDAVVFYVSKNKSGKLSAYAVTVEETLDKAACYHKIMVGFSADKKVKEVLMLSLSCIYSHPADSLGFLAQFHKKDKAALDKLVLGKNIDGVTRATLTSSLTIKNTRKAAALLNMFYK